MNEKHICPSCGQEMMIGHDGNEWVAFCEDCGIDKPIDYQPNYDRLQLLKAGQMELPLGEWDVSPDILKQIEAQL